MKLRVWLGQITNNTGWWFGTFFSISYMGCHPSHWRTPSFFRGVGQPSTSLNLGFARRSSRGFLAGNDGNFLLILWWWDPGFCRPMLLPIWSRHAGILSVSWWTNTTWHCKHSYYSICYYSVWFIFNTFFTVFNNIKQYLTLFNTI